MTTPVIPRCPHFGSCGGCQYQDLAYAEQLRRKRAHLADLIRQAHIQASHDIILHSAEPYHYRNRIRLRVERLHETEGIETESAVTESVVTESTAGQLRFGYNIRATTEFLPITTCPIAAPILWDTAQSLLTAAQADRDAAFWLNAAGEVELFCNHDQTRLQVTLFCAPRTKVPRSPKENQLGSFDRAFAAFQAHAPAITGAGAIASDPRTGPTGRVLAAAGSPGLAYTVTVPHGPAETYWITRGGFFQVNRFLLETLLTLVCFEGSAGSGDKASIRPRSGTLAWDLYAGVGLFSRILARTFDRITAVEANPVAAADLRSTLTKLSPNSTTIESTTLDFLRSAMLQRDRPDLIVLDPPRAGAGLEACAILGQLAAPTLVYVSCDPATLTRDLALLQRTYRIAALHVVDLFPQTFHLETVAVLEHVRKPVGERIRECTL